MHAELRINGIENVYDVVKKENPTHIDFTRQTGVLHREGVYVIYYFGRVRQNTLVIKLYLMMDSI